LLHETGEFQSKMLVLKFLKQFHNLAENLVVYNWVCH